MIWDKGKLTWDRSPLWVHSEISFSCSMVSFLSYTGRSDRWSGRVFRTVMVKWARLLQGQTGTSLFWCQTWTISGHKLDFSRADYNSRKRNKNRCLFHLLSVMYQLTENKQNTMILLTCDNHIKIEVPGQRRYVWKLFLQLNWLSWIFPALYHPGLISYQQ